MFQNNQKRLFAKQSRQNGLAKARIDYQKAYGMIAHSWILRCLHIFKIADNIKSHIKKSMINWGTELTSGKVTLGSVKIRRGIFQGDSLSPLVIVIALLPLLIMLRKVKAGYDLGGNKGTVNHLLFMDDLKLYGKYETQLDTLVNSVRIFRKLLTVYRAFHSQGDVDRLYFKRNQGGRGLISVEGCVDVEVNNLHKYVESCDEKLLTLVSKVDMLEEGKEKKGNPESKM